METPSSFSLAASFETLWVLLGLAALVCCVVVLVHASEPTPNIASALDGLDPIQSNCAGKAAIDVTAAGMPQVRDATGTVIAKLILRESVYCGTRWPQIVLTAPAARRLKGRMVELGVTRRADHRTEPYNLPLRGGQKGFGYMLAESSSCVVATARLLPLGQAPGGPAAQTGCA